MSRRNGRPARTVLLAGFEPFGGQAVNPSALAVRALSDREISGRRVVSAVLPVRFGDATECLKQALQRTRAELVVCVGEAGGSSGVSVERVAINVDDARIPDNAGARPIDRVIVRRGPAAYWSTLPIKAIVAALTRNDVPAVVSQTAGTYVCNHVFYGLMHALARRRGVRGGFLHVPFLPEQAAAKSPSTPSMALERIVSAVEIAIATSLTTGRDIRMTGGATY